MKTCPYCGERVYNIGCVNCNEQDYIDEQDWLTDLQYPDAPVAPPTPEAGEERP